MSLNDKTNRGGVGWTWVWQMWLMVGQRHT